RGGQMRRRRVHRADAADLRRRTQHVVSERQKKSLTTQLSDPEARRLVHELEVHQMELELQNEELRVARHETEAGLERYTELFDFAPIGHATVEVDYTIREINHAGARLLGKDRSRLLGTSFKNFVDLVDQSAFTALVARAGDPEANKI